MSISPRCGSIQGPSGKQHSDAFDQDRLELIEYYQSLGFFKVKVTSVIRQGIDAGQVDVTFVISEGIRYKVRYVSPSFMLWLIDSSRAGSFVSPSEPRPE